MTAYLTTTTNAPLDLASIDLDQLDQLIEQSAGQESLAEREGYGGEEKDRSWKAHVQCRINEPKLSWQYPTSASERAELAKSGEELYTEVTESPEHNFVAMRGVVLSAHYGFSMRKREDDKTETLCRTTALYDYFDNPDSPVITTDSHPLEIPVNQIHQNKDNPHQLNTWLANRPHLQLFGSRPPVGTPEGMKTSKVRSCKECVEAGEHYVGTLEQFLDSSSQIPACRMEGYFYFCVMQLGILDSSGALEGIPPSVKWVDIEDAKLMTQRNGELVRRKEPFIIKVEGMTKVQHWSLGTNQFERNVIRSGKSCYLPPNVMSWGDYFSKYLNDRKAQGRRLNIGGRTMYPVPTEIYVGKLQAKEYGATHMPVFRAVEDPEVISAGVGLKPIDWLKTAIQCFQYERALVNGNVLKAPAVTAPLYIPLPAKEDPAIEALVTEELAKDEAPTNDVASTRKKSAFSAFSGPKKS